MNYCLQVEGHGPSPLLSTDEIITGVLCGSSIQERHGHTGESPEEGRRDSSDTGASAVQKEAARAGTRLESQLQEFIPEERRLRGILAMCRNTRWEGMKKTEPVSSQWRPLTGHEAVGTN